MDNNIDKANDLVYSTLNLLRTLENQDIDLKEKEEFLKAMDTLEEVRHLLYELRNERKLEMGIKRTLRRTFYFVYKSIKLNTVE